MNLLAKIEWWMYMIMAIAIFSVVLLVNYILKKYNERRLEDSLRRLMNKTSVSRYSQVHRQPLEMPSRTRLESIVEQSNPPTITKPLPIDQTKDQIQIMHFPESKKIDTTSANEVRVNICKPESSTSHLGAIYQDPSRIVKKCGSFSNADRDSILDEIIDRVIMKIDRSKSAASIKG